MPAAVAAYHDLLAADPALAAESAAALLHGQDARGLIYARRLVCGVLRPRFFTPTQYRLLHDRASGLLGQRRRLLLSPLDVELIERSVGLIARWDGRDWTDQDIEQVGVEVRRGGVRVADLRDVVAQRCGDGPVQRGGGKQDRGRDLQVALLQPPIPKRHRFFPDPSRLTAGQVCRANCR